MYELKRKVESAVENASGIWGIKAVDITKGDSFAINEDEPFYAASLIKVPIMAAVFDRAEKGEVRLGHHYTLQKEDIVGGSGVLQYMSPGLKISIQDLITLMIIQSDNTATNILIEIIGIDKIQAVMNLNGMGNSRICHKLMIVQANRVDSNVLTSSDMTNLFELMATGGIISLHASEQMIRIMKQQQLSNGLTTNLPYPSSQVVGIIPEWAFAGKTGSVENIMHECGIIYAGSRAIAVTVMSKDCCEKEARETIAQIGKVVYESLLTREKR